MGTKFYFVLTVFILICFVGNAQSGFLKASGKKIVNANGDEVILRGIGMGGWMLQEGYMLETSDFAGTQHDIRNTMKNLVGEEATNDFYNSWRTNYCQKEDVDSLAAWGFNSIRLPMHYNLFTLPIEEEPVAGQDTWIDTGFQMVDKLLQWCTANKVYLILDLHAAPGGQGKDANISDYDSSKPSLWESAENRRKTAALWKKLAQRYANEPWIGGYDLLNEPNWDIDNAGNQNGCSCNQNTALWSLYKELIKAVRSVDTNHLLIIEGNCWGNNYNGLSNLKSYDNNIAMSFHKYWNYNDAGSISGMINLRNSLNVPLWLGESGENSNVWFTNAIRLAESNGIGWAWWPYKKIGSVTGPVTIPETEGWKNLLNYWKGSGAKPSEEQATEWIMEQAEKLKLSNCTIHRDVMDAMFRQVKDRSAKPYINHAVPGTIFVTDYDLGSNGYAYLDADTADYHSTTNNYTAWNSGYAYRNDGVDIEACTDAGGTNGFDVGWTGTGEWLGFTVDIDQTAAYSIDLRYAAQGSSSKVHFELDGVAVTPVTTLPSTGGWTSWGTKTISNVILKKGRHQIKLYIDLAGMNLNYFKVHTPTDMGSITPSIINIKTDAPGEKIKLASNLGFDIASLPTTGEFVLKVNNSLRGIESIAFDSTHNEVLALKTSETLISTDKIFLSYKGSSLRSPYQTVYAPFEDREVINSAPTYLLLPGRIQAENFIVNNGFSIETCTDTGAGQSLGYANAGDYTDYNVYVSNKGLYEMDFRIASNVTGKFELRLVEDDKVTTLCTINVTSTGGWQVWKTLSAEVNLKQGRNRLRYYAVSGEFNLNWFSATTITGVSSLEDSGNLHVVYSSAEQTIHLLAEGNQGEYCLVNCFDVNGRKFWTKKVVLDSENAAINNVSLPKGVYFLSMETTKNRSVQKLMVQ